MAKRINTKQNKKRTTLIVFFSSLGVVLILFILFYFIAGYYLFEFAMDATFAAVNNAPKAMLTDMPKPKMQQEWFDSVPKTQENIYSNDGYKLNAYQILADNNEHKWIITIHGYRGSAMEMTNYAYHFYNQGFNVLMPDLKGHGLSEGKFIGMGYTDRLDIVNWIDYIIEQDEQAQIVLHGVSMGGATVMMTTGENLPENVICAIEDCGYSNVNDQFEHIVESYLKLPMKNLIISAAEIYVRMNLKARFAEMDVISQLKKSTTPTLFIHGNKDEFVPFKMLDEVYNANGNIEKQKLVVDGAVHVFSATQNESLYFGTIFDFVNKYLKSE